MLFEFKVQSKAQFLEACTEASGKVQSPKQTTNCISNRMPLVGCSLQTTSKPYTQNDSSDRNPNNLPVFKEVVGLTR